MPRYFFHLRSQATQIEDSEGMELPNLNAALEEVLKVDRDLTADPAGVYSLEFRITDSSGRTLLKVPLQERRRNGFVTAQANSDEHRAQNLD